MATREEIEKATPHWAKRVRLALLLMAIALATVPFSAAEASAADCSAAPAGPSLELVYRLQEAEPGPASARDEAIGILCERVLTLGAGGLVEAAGETEIRVVLPRPQGGVPRQAIDWIGARGQVLFYDWEANLIGRERRIGGHPGILSPPGALRRAEGDWRAAGRNPDRALNQQLVLAGAFPNLYGAVRLASRQRPRGRCDTCSSTTPRFYLFDRSPRHRLLAGPAASPDGLRGGSAGGPEAAGVVLRVPVGTAVVSEQPIDASGKVRRDVAPGWYALRDRPALTGADIVDPRQEVGEYNIPGVTFGFTPAGRVAFERVTRTIARRGLARTRGRGPIAAEHAEALSGHFAIALDGEVKVRPIVNFVENPAGIDGRTGARISGGFANTEEAQDLATILRIGALPAEIELVRAARL